ncbi:hypothetical protein AVO45_09375 [Ruegeria marisrubri]|uniref:PepSY domain-containing protein n=1 Tax=Ruegeria marisrubri TaxID=1685379 RepID=A0A0X3TR17_9RHOB|nr:PepSY domain-containing protein [Ruegeria marisrubri]KUJ78153.1 hypothetical protein AVO45_09375 [Ruegeria marisrubri]
MKTLAVIASLVLATPALASQLSADTQLGTTNEEITASLQDLGYKVRKIEVEDGKIEAYVIKGDEMAEVYIDPESGKVVKVKAK